MPGVPVPALPDFYRDPLSYPGSPADTSMLLLSACEHTLTPGPQGLAEAQVACCDGCADPADPREASLGSHFVTRAVASVDDRHPVVAVGSNACPGVMRGKMRRAGLEPAIPLVKARVENLRAGHSAHVSRPGFVAAAPCHVAGEESDVVVGWLDEDQLACLDATEPNYDRRLLSGDDYPLRLDGDEELQAFYVYVSKWGVLAEEGEPVALSPQRDLFDRLSAMGLPPWADEPPEQASRLLAGSAELRAAVREDFVDRGLVRPAGIRASGGSRH